MLIILGLRYIEDASSADHSESSNKENELQKDWLIDIPLGNTVNQIFPLYFLAVNVVNVGNIN